MPDVFVAGHSTGVCAFYSIDKSTALLVTQVHLLLHMSLILSQEYLLADLMTEMFLELSLLYIVCA